MKRISKEFIRYTNDRKNHDYYIVWDNERVPIIKCKGNDIIENWDDVLAVAFDTCFVDCRTEQGFLIRE